MGELSKPKDGFISRFINRKISERITKFIIEREIPLTPNKVTVISFFIAIFSSILYVIKLPALGGIFAQISSIVDGVDGEIARLTGQSTPQGAFLDTVLDRIADIFIILGASLFVAKTKGFTWDVLVVSIFALSGDLLVSYIHSEERGLEAKIENLKSKVPLFATRDIRIFIIFLFSVIGKVTEGLVFVGFLSYLYIGLKSWDLYQKAATS